MKSLLLSALLVFLLLAIVGSLVPFDITPLPLDTAVARLSAALTAPPIIASRIDFFSNVLLFVPLGFLLTGYLTVRFSRVPGGVIDLWIALIASVLVSTAIEAVQVFLPSRTVAPSDIIGETLGGLAGAGLWLLAGRFICGAFDSRHHRHQAQSPALVLLASYALLYAAAQWLPFDITLEPSELGQKFRAGRIVVIPFATRPGAGGEWVAHAVVTALAAAPLGALLAWVARRGMRAAAIALGLVAIAAVEAVQVFIVSRTADTTDVLIGAAGLLAGAIVAAAEVRSTSDYNRHALVAAALWAGGIAVSTWSPFDFSLDPEMVRQHWLSFLSVPFAGYFAASEWNALVNLAQKLVLVTPLGFLLGVGFRVDQPDSGTRAVIAVTALGVLLLGSEVGQVYLPGRSPDVTDVIVGTLAGAAGIIMLASFPSAFRPRGGMDSRGRTAWRG